MRPVRSGGQFVAEAPDGGGSLSAALRSARVAIAAALLAAVAINGLLAWQTGAATERLQRQEFELVRQARLLEGSAPKVLSDGRSFLLTADSRHLADLAADRDEAFASLARLRALVRTSEGLVLVDRIESRLTTEIDAMQRRIELAQQGRVGEARAELIAASGAERELFRSLDELVEHEEALLRRRPDDLQRERIVGLAASTFLLALVGVAAVSLLTRSQRAVETSQRELLERARHSALSADIGAALTSNDPFEIKLQRSAEAVVRHLDAALARIWTLNEQENVLELRASAGMYTHLDGSHARVPLGTLKIGLIAQERKPHLTNAVIGLPSR